MAKTLVEVFYDEMGLNQSKAENSSNKLVSNDLSIKKDSKKSDKFNIFNEKLVNNNLKKSNDVNKLEKITELDELCINMSKRYLQANYIDDGTIMINNNDINIFNTLNQHLIF